MNGNKYGKVYAVRLNKEEEDMLNDLSGKNPTEKIKSLLRGTVIPNKLWSKKEMADFLKIGEYSKEWNTFMSNINKIYVK